MSSRVFVTALRRATTMARPSMAAIARPAFRQTMLKSATVSILSVSFFLLLLTTSFQRFLKYVA